MSVELGPLVLDSSNKIWKSYAHTDSPHKFYKGGIKDLLHIEHAAWESPKLGTCSSTNNEGNLKIKYTRPKNFEIITYATDSLDKHQNHEGWVVRCFPHATGF